jgi:hypothetical protein
MSFSVLVKTTPHMLGSYTYELVNREAAEIFVKRSDVWWWCFPVEEDTLDGGSWHRGGAWEIAAMQSGIGGDLSAFKAEVADSIPVQAHPANDQEEEDDDRW